MDTLGVLRVLPRAVTLALFGTLLAISPLAHADTPTVTQLTYDAGDHVATVTDPRGLVTAYTHDGLGQLWQQVNPDTGTTTFAYDTYGRQSSKTRANGVQTTYGYDGINRPSTISAGGLVQTFTYDSCTNGIGRLCSDGDASGATSYSYTPEGWIAGRGFTIGSTTYALGYSHDVLGHVSTVNYPDGNQASYTYTNGAVSAVTLTMGSTTINGATAITYRPMDMAMSAWTSSNGLVNTMAYDADGRLTGISVPGKQSLGFTYDTADRITQIANGIDGSLTQNFRYDDQSRLLSINSSSDNESFQYDANGNRLTQTGTIDTVSATSNRLVSSGGTQYGYDAMGNTTTVNATPTYHYDAFNRMDSAGGMTYYVNPEGQRLRKTGAAGTTWFAPDPGGSLLAENAGGAWVDYVWLNGRLIGRMAGGQAYAIHDDQAGRPEAVTDTSQNVVWRAQNFAFTQNVIVANVTLNLGFPGQYYDAETSAWNNGFRDYKSGLGRYVESDPIGLNGGVNTYAYVGDNPLNFYDPYGLGTLAVGGQAGGAFTTLGGSLSLQLSISWNSNALSDPSQWRIGGVFNASNVASTGVGVSAGGLLTYSPANCPEALRGLSPYSGGSAGEGLVGGGDVSYGDVNTYNLFIGAGAKAPVPVEIHTGVTWTAAKSFSLPQIGQALNALVPDGGI